MKRILFYTTCCFLALAFSSCSESDHNIDTEKPDESGPTISDEEGSLGSIPTTDKVLGILFPVTSITEEDGQSSFIYQNNKMIQGTSRYPYYGFRNFDFQIKEQPLQINITLYDEYDNSETKLSYTDIKTNKYGFITEAAYKYKSNGTITNGKLEASYDSKGYMTKQEIYEQFGNEYFLFTAYYIWENENLKQLSIYYEEKYDYDEYQECQYESDIYTLEYSNNASQNPNTGIYFGRDISGDEVTFDFMWYSGLFGKTGKNIPIRATNNYSWRTEKSNTNIIDEEEGEEYTDIKTFYNQDGSISSIQYSFDNDYEYIYHYGYNEEGNLNNTNY